jgi:hypothetical protein
MNRRSRSPQTTSRAGFTLLEVLLTSLLASVVLVSLWTLSDIYLRLFLAGERQIEETQLVRGLTQQISKDLSQVVQLPEDDALSMVDERPLGFPPGRNGELRMPMPRPPSPPNRRGPAGGPPPPMDRAPSGPPGRDGADSANSDSKVPPSDRAKPKFGLFGTKQALRLIVLQTDPRTVREITDLAEIMPQPGQSRPPIASELRAIEYTFSNVRQSVSNSNQHPSGLVRREWGWETWSGLRLATHLTADTAGASTSMLPDGQLPWTPEDSLLLESSKKTGKDLYHVPQVVGLEFHYYDGDTWEDEWDSWERRRLPVLVEVLLQVRVSKEPKVVDADEELAEMDDSSLSSADSYSSDGSSLSSSSYGSVYRKLIHLPFGEQPKSDEKRRETPVREISGESAQLGAIRP